MTRHFINLSIDVHAQTRNVKTIYARDGERTCNNIAPEVYHNSPVSLKNLYPVRLTGSDVLQIKITSYIQYQYQSDILLEEVTATDKTLHRIGNSHWYVVKFPILEGQTSQLRVLFKREAGESKHIPFLLTNDETHEAKVIELEDKGLLCCLDEAPAKYDPDVVTDLIQICNRQTHMIIALQSQVDTLVAREVKKEIEEHIAIPDLANIVTQY